MLAMLDHCCDRDLLPLITRPLKLQIVTGLHNPKRLKDEREHTN